VRPRIVSLLPSATEIVCALGFQDALVGRSHECDFPPDVARLPVLTAPKIRGEGTRDIHAAISEILRSDISVYRVDAELLRRLAPTHVVTQIQCEVCAVSLRDVEAAIADWTGAAPHLIPLNPRSLEDTFGDIRRTASALGTPETGDAVVQEMRSRMSAIAQKAAWCDRRPRVATVEWMEPLMAAGNWMPTIVEMAGGLNVLGQRRAHSPWISWDDLGASDPDIILVFPCGFRMADSRRDWHFLADHAEWPALRAVREGRVYICDGNQYFNRPGPRLVETLEIVAEILAPTAFRFGHEGLAWQRCAD
jgi:iron complex transport system substrate-binding protein